VLTLVATYHINDAPNTVEIERAPSEGWEITVYIFKGSLISGLETVVEIGFGPEALIYLDILSVRVIHELQNIVVVIDVIGF
jgi:hypothetical protein